MRRLRHTVEQILAKLRKAEIALSKREQPKRPVYKTLSDHVREVVGKEHLKRTKPLSVNQINGGQALAELHKEVPQALEIVRTYRRYLHDGHVTVEELAITKALSKGPQAYRHQTLSMIAAQELLARGVSLQAGDTIHYIITDADAAYPPDRDARWPDSMGPGATMSWPMTACF